MNLKEITMEELNVSLFIQDKITQLKSLVSEGLAVNALSGGVDSSVVTMLAHKALGDNLKTYFIDTGLMRQGESEYIVNLFSDLAVKVELIDAKEDFFSALSGLEDPEEKREAITQTFYKRVFGRIVKDSGAKFLLHGTNYTDIEETVAGVKRQHNILEQLGIDPEKTFGYKVLEPLAALRKEAVRELGKELGLPRQIYARPPFPGPALAARIIGEVTPERVKVVRAATAIVEEELKDSRAFQYLAILHKDKVTGVRSGKREFGNQIEVRCWDSRDARIGTPTELSFDILKRLGDRISGEVPGVVSVSYNITSKPPSTIEAI
jgi:GMP synthase (glutamine-hydrolysing)